MTKPVQTWCSGRQAVSWPNDDGFMKKARSDDLNDVLVLSRERQKRRCATCNRLLVLSMQLCNCGCANIHYSIPPHKTKPKTIKRPSRRQHQGRRS